MKKFATQLAALDDQPEQPKETVDEEKLKLKHEVGYLQNINKRLKIEVKAATLGLSEERDINHFVDKFQQLEKENETLKETLQFNKLKNQTSNEELNNIFKSLFELLKTKTTKQNLDENSTPKQVFEIIKVLLELNKETKTETDENSEETVEFYKKRFEKFKNICQDSIEKLVTAVRLTTGYRYSMKVHPIRPNIYSFTAKLDGLTLTFELNSDEKQVILIDSELENKNIPLFLATKVIEKHK